MLDKDLAGSDHSAVGHSRHRKTVHSATESGRFRHNSAMAEKTDSGKDQPPNLQVETFVEVRVWFRG